MSKTRTFLKYIFYISVILLIVLNLFPGSLLGLLFYSDLAKQPNLINNPFGTSINHFIAYFYVSFLGFFIYLKNQKLQRLTYGLFFLSIILEISQVVIPNRSFEVYDLAGNFIGVLVAYFLVKLYMWFSKK